MTIARERWKIKTLNDKVSIRQLNVVFQHQVIKDKESYQSEGEKMRQEILKIISYEYSS